MALVNPNIAMSYRPTVEYQPRNALAEAAQIQQIMGGQRQAEMADMQMEDLRRERGVLGQIAAAISAKGGPDLRTASLLMMQNPRTSEQGYNIYQALQKQQRLDEYERQFGGGAGAGATMPTSGAGAITGAAPAAAEPAAVFNESAISGLPTEVQKNIRTILGDAANLRNIPEDMRSSSRAALRLKQAEQLEQQAASMMAMSQRGAKGFSTPAEPQEVDAALTALRPAANQLAPAAPAPTNAMLAAQPATPPAGVNQLAAAGAVPNVDALRRQYNFAVKAGSPDAAVLLKQIESALKPDPSELRTMQQLGYPLTQEGYASFRAAQMREQAPPALVPILQNGRPVLVPREQAVGQTPFSPASVQVLGMGQGREAPAPTITQIQDPTNPSQMITIDARRYQGGGVGSPGVIGTSGKTPAVAAAAQKREEGATQAQDILDTLRTAYDELDRSRAIPSQQRNALSNALSYVAGTGVGQVAGRVVGTEAQTQRDIIQSARNQMLNAIKNATGMSAQQLNSNVEFRSWLEALTDPTRSIEANRAILSNMEKFIASGGKYSAKPSGAAPAAQPAGSATGGWSVVR